MLMATEFGDIDYSPLSHVIGAARDVQLVTNAKALREIALERLSEPILEDRDIRYVRAVLSTIVDELREAGAFDSDRGPGDDVDRIDAIMNALDVAVERAAHVVAAAWLRERGSMPIPSE